MLTARFVLEHANADWNHEICRHFMRLTDNCGMALFIADDYSELKAMENDVTSHLGDTQSVSLLSLSSPLLMIIIVAYPVDQYVR